MGCVHIYCGDGKGKTSAAIGLAIRASGRGKKVLIARFLKTDDSGEVAVLEGLEGITVVPCEKTFGFYSQMTDEQKTEARQYYQNVFEASWERAAAEGYNVLVLDEIMAACQYGLVKEETLLKCLKGRLEGLEVVLTGRNPSEALIVQADYVSEIRKVKHPYEEGLAAREGIEY